MDVVAIQRRIEGEVIGTADPRYGATRADMVWNQVTPDRHPDVIVRAKHEQDVVEAVRSAREHGLRVVARGGGHSWCGLALRHGGMLIDLSGLTDVTIDAAARTAAIQPSISNRDLMRELSPRGLAFPVGHCPTVKASGFLLSGGKSGRPSPARRRTPPPPGELAPRPVPSPAARPAGALLRILGRADVGREGRARTALRRTQRARHSQAGFSGLTGGAQAGGRTLGAWLSITWGASAVGRP